MLTLSTNSSFAPPVADEYDEVARVWMESWVSTGLEDASDSLLAKLRARVPMEIEKGWSLYVADDNGSWRRCSRCICPTAISTSCSSRRNIKATALGASCSPSRGSNLPDEIWLRCVRENEKAWRWYEREGFVFEKEQVEPMSGRVMKYYRWRKSA